MRPPSQKTEKQHYNVRINGEVEQSRERSSALGIVAIEKGAFWLLSTKVVNLTFFLIKKKSERSEKRKYTNT